MQAVFELKIEVTASAIDAQGHVNNVEFVRWMQEAAVAHSDVSGCTAATAAAGAMWVVRSHHIEYRRTAVLGDKLRALTWVSNFRRSFSLRKYQFIRESDGAVLASGETDWVFVQRDTGRPRSVPEAIAGMFQIVSDEAAPK